jgi:hypothetical protein
VRLPTQSGPRADRRLRRSGSDHPFGYHAVAARLLAALDRR